MDTDEVGLVGEDAASSASNSISNKLVFNASDFAAAAAATATAICFAIVEDSVSSAFKSISMFFISGGDVFEGEVRLSGFASSEFNSAVIKSSGFEGKVRLLGSRSSAFNSISMFSISGDPVFDSTSNSNSSLAGEISASFNKLSNASSCCVLDSNNLFKKSSWGLI